MRDFVPALAALRNAAPDTVIKILHDTFCHVTQMSPNEIVAAYQTVEAVAEHAGIANDPMVRRLLKAFKTQMIGLVGTHDRLDMLGLRRRFESVVGSKLFRDPFDLLG